MSTPAHAQPEISTAHIAAGCLAAHRRIDIAVQLRAKNGADHGPIAHAPNWFIENDAKGLTVGIVVGDDPDAAHLFAAAPDLLATLKSVEWSGQDDDGEGTLVPCCPSCGACEDDGHEDLCAVKAAIAKAKGGAA